MLKNLTTALLVFFATVAVAQTGLTCEDPIPVGKDYEGKIDGPCTVWYSANTYDLPLRVFFVPDSVGSTKSPEVLIDFTCTPGVYDDLLLDSLINKAAVFGVSVPIQFRCGVISMYGKNVYELTVNNSYRDDLSNAGLTYNVPAFVQVNFFESGTITLTPDTIFTSCIEHSQHVKLGDTLDILPNDSTRAFVLPYMDWKNDSIRFVWLGEGDARVWLAKDNCEFTPSTSSIYVDGYYDVKKDQPYKLQSQEIKDAIKDSQNGGVVFSKILSSAAGKLVIEKIPETPPAGGAILMEYGKSVAVQANSDQLYAFPKTWNNATMFQPSVSGEFQMQICNSHTFVESTGIYVNTYVANMYDEYAVHMTSLDMEFNTKNAKDKYMYVRFVTSKNTNVTPYLWSVSPCIDVSRPIYANQALNMTSSGSSYFYRLKYSEFSGYDLTVKWEGTTRMTFSIGDTCKFVNNSSNARVVHYKAVNKNTDYLIPAATVDSWAPRVDEEGFLYVRFSSVNGKITFLTEKPLEITPMDTTITDTICYGVTYEWNGQKYTTSGEYEQSFTATNGADSIVTLNLVVLPEVKPVLTDVTVEYGKTYEWNDKVYAETTTDTITLQDEHGCDYLAILKLTVLDKPASPCVLNSIELKVKDQLTLNLDSAFTVYRINYSEWAATGATLTWSGTEPLHTFVAETCEFYVAPYNKYVHAYVEVPAEGVLVLDKAMLTDLAAYVDEDGYLYIRFLTEKEGVLEVK